MSIRDLFICETPPTGAHHRRAFYVWEYGKTLRPKDTKFQWGVCCVTDFLFSQMMLSNVTHDTRSPPPFNQSPQWVSVWRLKVYSLRNWVYILQHASLGFIQVTTFELQQNIAVLLNKATVQQIPCMVFSVKCLWKKRKIVMRNSWLPCSWESFRFIFRHLHLRRLPKSASLAC